MIRTIAPLFAWALVASVPALASEYVAVPHFDSVELRGGGEVSLVPGPAQRVTIVNRSSQFTHIYMRRDGQLRIDACNERCPRNYDLQIRIESPRAPDVAIDGGGSVVASSGFAPQHHLSAAVNGGGSIDAPSIDPPAFTAAEDRKSTRLNSSHPSI